MSIRGNVNLPGASRLFEINDYLIVRGVVGQKYGDAAVELVTTFFDNTTPPIVLASLEEITKLHQVLTDIMAEAASVKLRERRHDE